MKTFLKILLKYYLKYISKLIIFIHKPIIIVVAGSANKYFVKQEIKNRLLEKDFSVRANPKNFNTEIGMPLAILNLPSGYNCYKKWLPIVYSAFKKIFQANFPKFLVLSLGSSDPGDMKYLLKIIKPEIAVITEITQRYMEGFSDLNGLLNEYVCLVKKLNKKNLLLLNNDNLRIKSLEGDTKAKVITFGFSSDSDCQADIFKKIASGQNIKINFKNKSYNYNIKKFGKHHVYAQMAGLIIQAYVSEKIT
ncbi:hypothetical protein KAU09_04635 [Candidatus Parcubacteria bacterium]|nr:hypothetical protein [Candidatus Parcubacteria bacterium]